MVDFVLDSSWGADCAAGDLHDADTEVQEVQHIASPLVFPVVWTVLGAIVVPGFGLFLASVPGLGARGARPPVVAQPVFLRRGWQVGTLMFRKTVFYIEAVIGHRRTSNKCCVQQVAIFITAPFPVNVLHEHATRLWHSGELICAAAPCMPFCKFQSPVPPDTCSRRQCMANSFNINKHLCDVIRLISKAFEADFHVVRNTFTHVLNEDIILRSTGQARRKRCLAQLFHGGARN